MRKVDIEGLLYCGVMGLVFGLVVILTIVLGRRKRTFTKSLFQSIGLAVLLYSIACLWWFSFVQVNTGILYFINKSLEHPYLYRLGMNRRF
ncbi:hypothetical protein J2T20_001168 [Paenibacillus wynnii]|nr:hypothetical protein [Paenibacillus wynnii]